MIVEPRTDARFVYVTKRLVGDYSIDPQNLSISQIYIEILNV